MIVLSPVDWLLAVAFNSEVVLFALGAGSILLTLVGSSTAIVLAIYSRIGSVWAVVGLVTSGLSLLLALTVPPLLFLLF